MNCDMRFINLSSVLRSGPVPDSPLEVGLGVSLDEGVDGADTAVGLGGVVHGLRCVLRRSVSGSISPQSILLCQLWEFSSGKNVSPHPSQDFT